MNYATYNGGFSLLFVAFRNCDGPDSFMTRYFIGIMNLFLGLSFSQSCIMLILKSLV